MVSSVFGAERIPGTQVTLTPPKSFVPSSDFNGYFDEQTGASIMIVEIPGSYEEVINGMTADAMKAKGMELISSEDVRVDGVGGKLMLVRIQSDGIAYRKWLLIFGEETTVMIHATATQEEFEKVSGELREAIMAAEWDASIEVGLLEALPFTMEEAGDLKFAFKMASSVVLTRDGVHPQREIEKPMVLVNVMSNPEFKADADQKAYAHALLAQTSKLPGELKVVEERAVQMGGKEGYFVSATGQPEESEAEILYEISVVVEEGRITLLYCKVASELREQYQPVFSKIRNSFKLVE